MGLLKGQNDIMNDGDCLQVINKIFVKQLQECVNYIEDTIKMQHTGMLKYSTTDVGRCIERAVSYIGYESTHIMLYDFINHYGLTVNDIDKLHNKYFIENCSPYDIYINDDISITINYENTIAYFSGKLSISDLFGNTQWTSYEYEYEMFQHVETAFISYTIMFNEDFRSLQKYFITDALKKYYNIN